jgi:hypothetical protein
MKKFAILFPVIFLGYVSFSIAQNKVEKYCQVIVKYKSGLTKVKRIAKISFGEDKGLFSFRDSLVMRQLKLVDDLTTETDVLNYMNKIGWSLVNVHSGLLYTAAEIFYFKKSFDNSELTE